MTVWILNKEAVFTSDTTNYNNEDNIKQLGPYAQDKLDSGLRPGPYAQDKLDSGLRPGRSRGWSYQRNFFPHLLKGQRKSHHNISCLVKACFLKKKKKKKCQKWWVNV